MSFRFQRGRVVVLIAAGIGVGLTAWVLSRSFPPSPLGLASDFRLFYSAAALVRAGGDPYRHAALALVEQRTWPAPGVAISYVYPPALAALLAPLSRLPFWTAYVVYSLLGLAAASATIALFARRLGWRHGGLLAAAVVTSWVGFSGLKVGQEDMFLLAALLGALLLAWSDRALGAGLLMGFAWLKPDLLWPAVIFLGLALWPDRRAVARYLVGALATSAVMLGLSLRLLPQWLHAMTAFGGSIGYPPNRAEAGLVSWVDALPPGWHLGVGLASPLTWGIVLAALASLAWLGHQILASPRWAGLSRERRLLWAVSLALGIWLLAAPDVHPNDYLLLLPALVLVLGKDGASAGRLGPAATVLLMATLPLPWHVPPVGLTPVAVVVLIAVGAAAFRRETEGSAQLPPRAVEEGAKPTMAVL
jgi:hypothetical protein